MTRDEVIWSIVRQIPRGFVASYGDVAKLCGLLRQARIVGHAMHRVPKGSGVPWHRVINSQGRISFPRKSRSYMRQKSLLVKEGIVFKGERIDMEKYSWLRKLDRDV